MSLSLFAGDQLKVTWFEPSHEFHIGDNDGVMVVNVWGKPAL